MLCAHFTPEQSHCAAGVCYLALAGGGVFGMVMRLPCIPITNRRGEEARMCAKYLATDKKGNSMTNIDGGQIAEYKAAA